MAIQAPQGADVGWRIALREGTLGDMNHGMSPAPDSILPVLHKIDEVERQLLVRLDRLDQKRATCEPGVSRLSRLTGPILASVVLCALAVFAFVILR
jgi:hypothetical protein